jgi:hypothetical protein
VRVCPKIQARYDKYWSFFRQCKTVEMRKHHSLVSVQRRVRIKLSLWRPRRHVGKWSCSCLGISLCTSSRTMVSFTLYSREQRHLYLLKRRLDGRQSRSRYFEGETKSLFRPGIKLRFLGRPACFLNIVSTMISRWPLSGAEIRYDWIFNLFSPCR